MNELTYRRRKWTSDEDDVLRAAVSTYGLDWKVVAEQLDRRFGLSVVSVRTCLH